MTPTSVPYDSMRPEDICIVTVDGAVVECERRPSSEFPLHALVYARRPEVGAIVHTHSPAVMAMAPLGLTLPAFLTGLVGAVGGDVLTAPQARPGTEGDGRPDRGGRAGPRGVLPAVAPRRAHAGECLQRRLGRRGAADAYLRILPLGPVPELPRTRSTGSPTIRDHSGRGPK